VTRILFILALPILACGSESDWSEPTTRQWPAECTDWFDGVGTAVACAEAINAANPTEEAP
jgi:hypothetical protein